MKRMAREQSRGDHFTRRVRPPRFAAALLLGGLALPLLATPALAQVSTRPEDLAAGKFLVAHRDLPDPNFFRTVILLVRFDEDGAMGLIVNRPMTLTLSRAFRELKAAQDRSDPVYAGGPVLRSAAVALRRASTEPAGDTRHVFGDVYLVSTKRDLEDTLAAGVKETAFRVYLGYAGWAPGQLEAEMQLGTWYILPARPAMVFDPDPETLWPRLIRLTEVRYALTPPLGRQKRPTDQQ